MQPLLNVSEPCHVIEMGTNPGPYRNRSNQTISLREISTRSRSQSILSNAKVKRISPTAKIHTTMQFQNIANQTLYQ